jgi:hypothetical protein
MMPPRRTTPLRHPQGLDELLSLALIDARNLTLRCCRWR